MMNHIFVTKDHLLDVLGIDTYQLAHLSQRVKLPTVVLFLKEYYVLPLVIENILAFMRGMSEGTMPKVMAETFEDLVMRFTAKDVTDLPAFVVPNRYIIDAIGNMRDHVEVNEGFVRKMFARHSSDDNSGSVKSAKSLMQLFPSNAV